MSTEFEVCITTTGEVLYVTEVTVKRASIVTIDTSLIESLGQCLSAFKVYEDVASVHANELRAWQALCNDLKALADARDLLVCVEAKERLDGVAEAIVQQFNTALDSNTITIGISSRPVPEAV